MHKPQACAGELPTVDAPAPAAHPVYAGTWFGSIDFPARGLVYVRARPVIPTVLRALLSPSTPTASVDRQHAFAQSISRKDTLKIPQPEVKIKEEKPVAPGLGIARSRSAPGSARGRISPCLRIPSPKFPSRDRGKSKEHDSEKDADSGTKEKSVRYGLGWGREKVRIVTPESVSAPILRDAHAHTRVREPGVASSNGHRHRYALTSGIDHSTA